MPINIQTLTSIFASVTYGSVLVLVLASRPLTRLRLAFVSYLSAMFIWSISALIIVAEFGDPLIWFKILVSSSILMLLSLFYFVQIFFATRFRWIVFVFWYGITAILLAIFSNLIILYAYVEAGFLVYAFHPFIAVIAGPGYFLFMFSLWQLIQGYKATVNEVHRTRLGYLIAALTLVLAGTVVNWTDFGKYPVDIAVNGFAAIMIAYAILRYSLLDIRFVFRTGLLYSIVTGITGGLYYLVISLTLRFLDQYTGLQIFALAIIVAIITSLILAPIRDKIQRWVDRLFYRQKYDASLMMQRLSEATSSLMELEALVGVITHEIQNTMQLERSHVFIKNPNGDAFTIIPKRVSAKGTLNQYPVDHPIAAWLSSGAKTLARDQLIIEPFFKSLWGSELTSLENSRIELFVPIHDEDELLGFFAIGSKRSGEAFTMEDQRILLTVANQTGLALKNARLYNELQETFFQTIVTLANAIDIRDSYTNDHSQRIANLAVKTAEMLGCNQDLQQQIYWGSLLHDIGKIGIPDSVLLKKGPLNEEEWEIIKQHPTIGANIIQPIKQLAHVSPIIQYSHEWYDGTGYPAGLEGNDIPLGARIVGVVDAFSAMIDKRIYKDARSLEETIGELKKFSGVQFDPKVVDAFLKVIESGEAIILEFPNEVSEGASE